MLLKVKATKAKI